MSILSASTLGGTALAVVVDHDPEVWPTDVPEGSLITYVVEGSSPVLFHKEDDGSTTNVKRLIECGDDDITARPICFYDSQGGQAITTEALLVLDAVSPGFDTDKYVLLGNQVKVEKKGIYWASYSLAYANASTNKDGSVAAWVEQDNGSGTWGEVVGSRSYSTHVGGADHSGSGASFPVRLVKNAKIRVKILRSDGTADLTTIQNKSSLSLMKAGSL